MVAQEQEALELKYLTIRNNCQVSNIILGEVQYHTQTSITPEHTEQHVRPPITLE